MSEGVSLDAVSRTMATLLAQAGHPVLLHDRVKDRTVAVAPDTAAAPDGLLPALLVAGEAVWREATGKGFMLDIRTDPEAVLGYRVAGIGAGSFATVMLSMMEATAQATRHDAFLVNDLGAIWRSVTERLDPAARTDAAASPVAAGASP